MKGKLSNGNCFCPVTGGRPKQNQTREDPGDMIVGIQLWSAKRVPTIRVPNSRKVQIGTNADVQFL